MTAVDPNNINPGLEAPAQNFAAVTPHDTNELAYITRALYVGSAGDVQVVGMTSGTVTFVGVPAGSLLPVRVRQVLEAGTTAGDIVALW